MLLITILLPIAAGLILLGWQPKLSRARSLFVEAAVIATSLLGAWCLFHPETAGAVLLQLTDKIALRFAIDGVGTVFTAIVIFLWPLASLYAFEYMKHEGGENHFLALYTITYGVTLGISTAANLITMYVFYECLTLCTMPLVMHGSEEESLHAGRQYMLYSFFGAALAFAGIMIVLGFSGTTDFVPGGVMGAAFAAEHPLLLQAGYLCMFLGFGVKAAVFPLHAWLPSASVAPTPVTALLHAVAVVKSGVFAIIRMTYFSIGASLLLGTPAQVIAVVLASLTIVYGSSMAVKEHHFKRRLAYSTVSNLSYIIMAASLMTVQGLTAGLTHMVFHAVIKISLFYCAGAVLVDTGRTQIEQLRGLGKVMPFTCAAYVLAALGLMGTPLLPGFVSKVMIGTAAASCGAVGLIGLAALLISAILTAVYLMGPAFYMCFRPLEPSGVVEAGKNCDPGWQMKVTLAVLAAVIVLFGLFSSQVVGVLETLTAGVV